MTEDLATDPVRLVESLGTLFRNTETHELATRCVYELCEKFPNEIDRLRAWGLLPHLATCMPYRALSVLVDTEGRIAEDVTRLGMVRTTVDMLVAKKSRDSHHYSEVAEFLRSVFETHSDAILENGNATRQAVHELHRVLGAPAEQLVDQVEWVLSAV